ncbi:CDP-paratose 2-epimerase [Thermodesulfobacteriota bacterium]
MHTFKSTMVLPYNIHRVFSFFSDAGNLEKITPPELCFSVITPMPLQMKENIVIDYKLRLFGIPFEWKARIRSWNSPSQFIDEQIQGPYRLWIHTHRFFDLGKATRITDEIVYALPLRPLGEAAFPFVHFLLMRIFRFREQAIHTILHQDR